MAWVPMSELVDIASAAWEVLDPEVFDRYMQSSIVRIHHDEMVQHAFRELMTSTAGDVKSVLSCSPQLWELMSHRACKIKVLDGGEPGFSVLRMYDVPNGFASSVGYQEGWRSAFAALLQQCQAYADVKVNVDPSNSRIDYHCSWTWNQTW